MVQELGEDFAVAFACDATDYDALKDVVERTVMHYGRLDVAFANAGTGVSKAGTEKGDPQQWQKMIDININALLYTAHASLPHLRKTQGQFILTSARLLGACHWKGLFMARVNGLPMALGKTWR